MHASTLLAVLPLLAGTFAAPVEEVKRAASASCPSYTIINTRGTGEIQGPSAGFRTMNSRVTSALSGGKIYNTVYAADFSQNSALGTQDIVNKITSTLRTNPKECFILEGYSQGAAATVNAMPKLTGANFDAVKGVFLIAFLATGSLRLLMSASLAMVSAILLTVRVSMRSTFSTPTMRPRRALVRLTSRSSWLKRKHSDELMMSALYLAFTYIVASFSFCR
jgi:hypothetical protein